MPDTEKRKNPQESKIVTIPNIMSLFRICLIPLIVWLYCVKYQYKWTFAVLLLSAATDVIDGWIARRFDMISDVGKVLDPVADKLTQGVTLLCLITKFPIMLLPLIVLVVKETIMGVMGLIAIKKTGVVYGADWHGKVTTCLLYLTMSIHVVWYDIPSLLSMVMIMFCIGVMLLSLALYSIRNLNQVKLNL